MSTKPSSEDSCKCPQTLARGVYSYANEKIAEQCGGCLRIRRQPCLKCTGGTWVFTRQQRDHDKAAHPVPKGSK